MNDFDEIKSILIQIRDNQQQALALQQEHLALVQRQLDEAKGRVEESLKMQREAVARFRSVGKVAVPAMLLCLAAIVYLVVRYL